MKYWKRLSVWTVALVLAGIVMVSGIPDGQAGAGGQSSSPASVYEGGYGEEGMGGYEPGGAGAKSEAATGYGGGMYGIASGGMAGGEGPYGMGMRARRGTPGALLVLSRQMNPADAAAVSEDLSVMARILDDKLRKELGEDYGKPRKSPFDSLLKSEDGTQPVYLQGYGVLFMTAVKFPVMVPPRAKEKQPEERGDALWQRTKQEMYGGGSVSMEHDGAVLRYDTLHIYPPERVEQLRQTLLETLKHATNIRKLGPDETVTVVVFGPGPAPHTMGSGMGGGGFGGMSGGGGGMYGGGGMMSGTAYGGYGMVTPGRSVSTVFTVKVQKGDVDALAEGQVKDTEFADRASILAYQMGPGGQITVPGHQKEETEAPSGPAGMPGMGRRRERKDSTEEELAPSTEGAPLPETGGSSR